LLTKEKIEGCYWGVALGDAIGMPVEFSNISFIKERYGEEGIQEPKDWAIWTDDTEMTFAVTEALLRLGSVEDIRNAEDQTIGTFFAEEYIKWLDNPGVAPGNTCTSAVNALRRRGASNWRFLMPAKNNSKGCGSVMRAAPLGLWIADSLTEELPKVMGINHQLLTRISNLQSEMTHGHKAATAAALAGSYAVILAVNGVTPSEMIDPTEKLCKSIHPDFPAAIERLKIALSNRENGNFTDDVEAIHYIGKGWVGEEAIAMALYAAIREPSDLKKCLRIAANHSGDSDSVACIAGSILGALHGIKIIPNDWIERLAEKKRMVELLNRVINFFKK